eukprot:393907-Pyramimonas_sp.AAC.1
MHLTIAEDSRSDPAPVPGQADSAAWCDASIAPRWLPCPWPSRRPVAPSPYLLLVTLTVSEMTP